MKVIKKMVQALNHSLAHVASRIRVLCFAHPLLSLWTETMHAVSMC
jgi:hypothetical protein